MPQELQDKLPPQNIEAETSLLGSLLLDKNALVKVVDFLQIRDFYKKTHQDIYEAAVELFEKEHPDFWKKFALSGNRHLYAPPKGESWLHVRRRAVPAMKKILKQYEGKTIMVVAHGGLNRILLSELLSIPLKRNSILSQKNACVNLVEIGKGRMSFRIYNDTSHLNGLASPKNKTGF